MQNLINDKNQAVTVSDAIYNTMCDEYSKDNNIGTVLLYDIHGVEQSIPTVLNNMNGRQRKETTTPLQSGTLQTVTARMLEIERVNMEYNEATNFGEHPERYHLKEPEINALLAEWDSLKEQRNKLKYATS